MKLRQSMLRISASLVLLCALGEAQTTVTVDYAQPKQTVVGFGAAITPFICCPVARDLNNFSAASQAAILNALYSTSIPSAGLSIIRAGSELCQFNPSPGVYNWNDLLIQSQISCIDQSVDRAVGLNTQSSRTRIPFLIGYITRRWPVESADGRPLGECP